MHEVQLLDDILRDYNVYHMKKGEFILSALVAGVIAGFIVWLFYGSWIAGLVAVPLGLFYPRFRCKTQAERRRNRLMDQFKEMLYALSSSMQAGQSIETAFSSIYKDLELLYPNPETEIMRELRGIAANLGAGIPLDTVLRNFAERSHEEDIATFVDVYATCRQMGGDLVEVMRATSDTISEKNEVRRDIAVAIASAQFEQKVLTLVPAGVLLMIKAISPGYLDAMYGTVQGILLSTMALAILGVAVVVGTRITNIKV